MKDYHPENGVELDFSFHAHRDQCDACRRVDPDNPGTLALLCLEGAVLWKRENATVGTGTSPARSETWAPKPKIKRLVRYVGD